MPRLFSRPIPDATVDARMTSAIWKQLVPLLAVALAVRLMAGLYWQSRLDGPFGFPDSESYWTLGRAIAQGQPYQVGPEHTQFFRTPGYPVLLAPIFHLAGRQPSVMWARMENAVLGTLTVAAVWWLGMRLFGARAALIAAAMAAFYPGAIASSILVLSEAAFCLLMLVQLALWTAAWRADSPARAVVLAVCAGTVAGGATLVRPSWLLFTPFAVALSVLAGGRCRELAPGETAGKTESQSPPSPLSPCGQGRLRHAWIGVVMLAAVTVVMIPWWVRGARMTGHFVPTTLQVGASLYDGLNPEATGASDMSFVPKFTEDERRRAAAADQTDGESFEFRLDRRFRREALSWAKAHPAEAARLAGVKLARMWNVWPNERSLSSWPIRLAVLFTYVPIAVFGIIGAARTIRAGWPYLLCWLPAVYFTLLHVVFVSSIRYRQPAMLGLMVLAAGVVGSRGIGKAGGAMKGAANE